MVSSWRLRFRLNHLEVWSQCQVYPLRFWQRLTCSSRVHKKCTCWGHGEREAGLEPDFGCSPMIFWTLGSLLAHWSPSRIEARATSIQVRHPPPSHTKSRGPEPRGRTWQSIYSTTSTTQKKMFKFWSRLKHIETETILRLGEYTHSIARSCNPRLNKDNSWFARALQLARAVRPIWPNPKHCCQSPNTFLQPQTWWNYC